MRFKPEDFHIFIIRKDDSAADTMARIANAKLEEMLKDAPVVKSSSKELWVDMNNPVVITSEYKAKLVCIEEIK